MDKNLTERTTFSGLAALLCVAFVLGGGGSYFGLANLAVKLVALAILLPSRGAFLQFWAQSPVLLRILVSASLLLPLIQIVPLPPSLWEEIPGRNLVTRSLELTGVVGWMPLSVSPLRTLLAFTALITPMAILAAGWTLPRQRLIGLGWLVVGFGIATTLLGVFQLGATGNEATLFGARNPGDVLLGTFANRNSTGLLLGFSLTLAALLPAPKPHLAMVAVRLAVCAVLLLAIILTRSRTAVVLAMLPLAMAGIKAVWWFVRERETVDARGIAARPLAIMLGAIGLVAVSTAALTVTAPGPIEKTIERFEAKDDPRRYIWDDASYTAARYWPAGAGMGTFDEVFQVDESLENLTQRTAGRAHNDYLELAIEAGLPGLVLAALWLLLVALLSWRARHSPQRWAAWSGSVFLVMIALQSISDYPLRSQTLLALAGFALLMLARTADDQGRARP
ncbi:exopolysaccharide production protein ExoQ [Porphyrobacter sp. MBR-155]